MTIIIFGVFPFSLQKIKFRVVPAVPSCLSSLSIHAFLHFFNIAGRSTVWQIGLTPASSDSWVVVPQSTVLRLKPYLSRVERRDIFRNILPQVCTGGAWIGPSALSLLCLVFWPYLT